MSNQTKAHQELVHAILLAVSQTNRARVWKRVNGVFRMPHSEQMIRVGVEGAPDIEGILNGGRYLGIEVKTGSGKLSEAQRNFEQMILSHGGLYFVAREVKVAVDAVNYWGRVS